ncbi:hypothetical protein GGR55DRAFT_666377 [Xylaria sp. FL0064]|nr:hypothetical protein GGR55DRAFT_666377 [Xylaria sp. FL0064]
MCTEVYNLFGDPKCQHKEFQNTFPCHIARRCRADDDQLLNEPVFLPTKPPSVPPGLFGCKISKETRPIAGKCRDCSRRQRKTTPTKTVSGSNYHLGFYCRVKRMAKSSIKLADSSPRLWIAVL